MPSFDIVNAPSDFTFLERMFSSPIVPPPSGFPQTWVSPFLDQSKPEFSGSHDLNNEASRTRSNSIGSDSGNSSSSSTSSSSKKLSAEYLTELEDDLLKLTILPIPAPQITLTILRKEISRVRGILDQNEFSGCSQMDLPAPKGPIIKVSKKFYVPVEDYPWYNFVGRILGPRGMTVKQFEQETGCRLLLRGKGSRRGGVPVTTEEDLHVLVICEDTKNRVTAKLQKASEHVMKLLIPGPGVDEIKKNQLAKLALLNGNYRPSNNF